jgi:SAM-dependent methyltransferase
VEEAVRLIQSIGARLGVQRVLRSTGAGQAYDAAVAYDSDTGSDHLRAVTRVYGPETWDLYEILDRSIEPRSPDLMHGWAAEYLTPQSVVLDVGCRDAAHLIRLVQATGATGIGIEPVGRLVEQAQHAISEAGLDERIQVVRGVMQDLPYPDDRFDLVWCRDVVELVEGLEAALGEVVRVLRPDGHVVLYTVFATDRLEPKEAAMLERNLTIVPANLDEHTVEDAFAKSQLMVVRKDVIGTEWREHAEERTQPVSRDLLRLARLRRQRDHIIDKVGLDIYDHVQSNLHWLVYQFLGKLQPTLYLLRNG